MFLVNGRTFPAIEQAIAHAKKETNSHKGKIYIWQRVAVVTPTEPTVTIEQSFLDKLSRTLTNDVPVPYQHY